jgi:vanillate O-demethylase ferredoxin subunit
VHDRLRVGDRVRVGAPRHQFNLVDDAKPSLLIAGGIGITPLLPMAQELERTGRPWRLHYSTRDPSAAPFAPQLDALGDKVRMHSSQASGRLDLRRLVDQAEPGTHFYCCGPSGMLDAFAAATRDLDPDQVHMERFETIAPPADAGSFEILLAKSKISVVVGPEVSALDAMLQAGVHVEYSCRQGICGSCEVRVLDGVPEHHDEILTEAERASNRTVMLCCSRSSTPLLVLDL